MRKLEKHANSMTVRILLAVVAGILLAVGAVSGIVINRSTDIFLDTYGKSQENVFLQIEEELNNYHENLSKIIDAVDSSWAFRLYFTDQVLHSKMEFQRAYEMDKDLDTAIPTNISDISVMLIGMNGKSYLNREETIILSPEEILKSDVTEKAMEKKEGITYQYAETGFTSTTRNAPVIMATKVLRYRESQKPYAVVYITMKESAMSKFYEYFISEYSQFYMTDECGKIVSTDQKENLGESKDVMNSQDVTVLKKYLPYYNYTICGIIDSRKALGRLYDVPQLWVFCGLIAGGVILITFFSIRQTTKSLSALVQKMGNARNEKYDEHIEVTGSYEVQELTRTYNSMLDDLNRYIDELMNIQKEKRKAEISALQMQINPHYVYNTLASIKWMIYEGEVDKSTRAIDAFISLLRSTIGNMDEYISVESEIENLKNYVLINNNRYGDKIQVEYFVNFGCEEVLIPKMILQPFVENAFFHAFPYERKGRITILVRLLEEKLQIHIVDDGVGMNQKRLLELSQGNTKSEHFTGIGVNNVDDRLKLIYGASYGIDIQSQENRGTTITIEIPAKREK
ncbi:MAG: sensor histidine kinase [Lachnospiraceae bacterium]|nr:sensor histidine kinase [Lachnospiraceae bacterium]